MELFPPANDREFWTLDACAASHLSAISDRLQSGEKILCASDDPPADSCLHRSLLLAGSLFTIPGSEGI
jgi:hypothetical protein